MRLIAIKYFNWLTTLWNSNLWEIYLRLKRSFSFFFGLKLFSIFTHLWHMLKIKSHFQEHRCIPPSVCLCYLSTFLHMLSVKLTFVCHLFFSQILLPTRGRSLRPLTSATRLKSAVWWTSTLRTPPWTKVRPEHFCWNRAAWLNALFFFLQCHYGRMM